MTEAFEKRSGFFRFAEEVAELGFQVHDRQLLAGGLDACDGTESFVPAVEDFGRNRTGGFFFGADTLFLMKDHASPQSKAAGQRELVGGVSGGKRRDLACAGQAELD